MQKLMKIKITVETVALVNEEYVTISGLDGSIIDLKPEFCHGVLSETLRYNPTDMYVDMTEIKGIADLPYGWEMDCIPFMGENDLTIKQLLEEVSDEKQNPDSQGN